MARSPWIQLGGSRAGRNAEPPPSLAALRAAQVSAWLASAGATPAGPLKLERARVGKRGRPRACEEPGSDRGGQLRKSPFQFRANARASSNPSPWARLGGCHSVRPLASPVHRGQPSPWVPSRKCVGGCRWWCLPPVPEPAAGAAQEHEGAVHANEPAVADFAGCTTPRSRDPAPLARQVPRSAEKETV